MDKGYAVKRLVEDSRLGSAIAIGDDTTDVDAWRALRELADRGELSGLSVAVEHPNSTAAVLGSADYVLDGVGETVTFLEWLDGRLP